MNRSIGDPAAGIGGRGRMVWPGLAPPVGKWGRIVSFETDFD
jgi:hypothetical protein